MTFLDSVKIIFHIRVLLQKFADSSDDSLANLAFNALLCRRDTCSSSDASLELVYSQDSSWRE